VDVLRVIKAVLGVSLVVFTVAGVSVSSMVSDREKALREVARYNTVWAVSQATGEFQRFIARVAAYAVPGSGVDKDEVQLRFDILNNRLDIFSRGDVKEFTDSKPEQRETVEGFSRFLAEIDPLVQNIDAPGSVLRILNLARPLEGKLAHMAASANAYGGDQANADQHRLLELHWMFSGIAAALVVCGLAFIVLLFLQNRLLTTAYERMRILAEDLHAAKNEADAASEAKSRFLATMSHELRTPLNAVIGFSEIIAGETFGPVGQQAYRTYAGDILRSGQHMLDLVTDILTMAKLDAGRFEVAPTPVDLRETVERAVKMFRGTKHAEGRSLTLSPEGPWPWINADELAVRQMLLNLLSNAAKFSEPEKPIEVHCRTSPGGEIVVTVADHGIGMTRDDAALAVRPFYQADSRLSRKYEGSGLGLSIVSGLMTCHGGQLVIDSEPGEGSQISLVFPASAACKPHLAAVA
jgi:two-component system, cell cycle sensor histidine kinase PleC